MYSQKEWIANNDEMACGTEEGDYNSSKQQIFLYKLKLLVIQWFLCCFIQFQTITLIIIMRFRLLLLIRNSSEMVNLPLI